VRESERAYDDDNGGLGHFSSRLSTYDMPSLPADIASIPLYAPPREAGCSDAPALSSFAPRAPLRPRAATVGDQVAVPPKPAQTVAQAARTYTIKRAQTLAAKHEAATAAGEGKPRYKAGDSVSRRSARKPQVVPAGWGTAAAIDSKDAEGK
jgi:hypothetical protein